jgi:hypothetical protein
MLRGSQHPARALSNMAPRLRRFPNLSKKKFAGAMPVSHVEQECACPRAQGCKKRPRLKLWRSGPYGDCCARGRAHSAARISPKYEI